MLSGALKLLMKTDTSPLQDGGNMVYDMIYKIIITIFRCIKLYVRVLILSEELEMLSYLLFTVEELQWHQMVVIYYVAILNNWNV